MSQTDTCNALLVTKGCFCNLEPSDCKGNVTNSVLVECINTNNTPAVASKEVRL